MKRRPPRWTPSFEIALRIALRPALAYTILTALGFLSLTLVVLSYERNVETSFWASAFGGMLGIVVGQVVGILRVRIWPVLLIGVLAAFFVATFVGLAELHVDGDVVLPMVCFAFALPCGLLALQHSGELFASFWPSIGWIGSVFVILNSENRIDEWEKEKVSAWLPLPLFLLACFLTLWIVFLASKQAMRVELWQALSGATSRRVERNASVSALPKRNLTSLVVVAGIVFAITAVLAPYLWRTGKGDHGGHDQGMTEPPSETTRRPVDGDRLLQELLEVAHAAEEAALHLWPLLLLLAAYRPAKRAFLQRHLLRPVLPTPPTERIDNGWEYVRIAAGDAGVTTLASDSVEDLLLRMKEKNVGGPAVDEAARIYTRTRYGFTVAPGDAGAMQRSAKDAGRELRAHLSPWVRVRNLWRSLP